MDSESNEPFSSKPVRGTGDGENPQIPACENPIDSSFDFPGDEDDGDSSNELSSFQGRHDGWTGQRMAMFCAMLAETGIVTDACIAVGMSTTSAYSARRRNPLFAAAWEESLKLARDRLADALLERSLSGCVEKYYRDGELVGEKRVIDSRLGMQVLRRLDKRAEQLGIAQSSVRPPQPRTGSAESRSALARASGEGPDWDLMLSALRSGEEAMIAEALAEAGKLEGHKVGEVGEVCVAGNPAAPGVNFEDDEELPDPRCWWDEDDDVWMTDFPPPPGFAGYEKGRWGDEEYSRECTAEESARLKAAYEAELADEHSADEQERDAWFARLGDGRLVPAPEPPSPDS